MDLLYIIGFFAVGQGLFQLFMLYKSKTGRTKEQYLLLLILAFLSISIFEYSLVWSGDIGLLPHLIGFTSLFQFLFLPIIYLIYKRNTLLDGKWKATIHLIPFIICFILFSDLLFQNGLTKLNHLSSIYLFKIPFLGVSIPLCLLFIFQAVVYAVLLNKLKFKNLTIYGSLLFKLFVVYISIHVFHSFIIYFYPQLIAIAGSGILLFSIFCIYAISYLVYKRQLIIEDEKPEKYAHSNLRLADSKRILNKLDTLILTDDYFTDSDIRMNMVAKKINVPVQQLSQAINQVKGVSFRVYLNGVRVEYAVAHIKANATKQVSLKELSFDAGFNNKTSFANAFKKKMSMTPSQFLASQKTI